MKILRGADFDDFLKEIKKKFSAVKVVRPPAVRTSSSEVYLVCSGKKS
jgi:23S rRNA U2552 (ribose-2'-O)-methylase RlmE/FtsJ